MERQFGKPDSASAPQQWWVRKSPVGIYMAVFGECQEEMGYQCVFGPATFVECDEWINRQILNTAGE